MHQSSAHRAFTELFNCSLFLLFCSTRKCIVDTVLWQCIEIIHWITELKNNSLWKGSKNVSRPASCWKQSQLCNQTWLLRALSKYVLENLQGWKLHNHFGQPAHCLAVLIVKEFLLIFIPNLSCFILGLMPPASCPVRQCEHPPSVQSHPADTEAAAGLPQSPLCSQRLEPSSLSLSQRTSAPVPFDHLGGPSLNPLQFIKEFIRWQSNTACSFPVLVQQVLTRGSWSFGPNVLAMLLLRESRKILACQLPGLAAVSGPVHCPPVPPGLPQESYTL